MKTVRVAVSGAGGQIGYSLLFRLASGEVFGPDVSVELALVEVPQGFAAAQGTAMELVDCAFPLLRRVDCFDNPHQGFDGVHWALLVGAMPRGPGMERADLLAKNGEIFKTQGQALLRADSGLRVVVVGNPCNTNALIAMANCQDVPSERFAAMMALDENRARAHLAAKTGSEITQVRNLVVWGNHSPTMYPDFENARIGDMACTDAVGDRSWLENTFVPMVQQRGAAIIAARGKSSAASAASACLDHIRRVSTATAVGQVYSAAILSSGSFYEIPPGIFFSFPLRTTAGGKVTVVENFAISEYGRAKLRASADELLAEREAVKHLIPNL